MNEIWRDIIGFIWYYQASNYWRIRSLDREVVSWKLYTRISKWKILLPKIRKNWYLEVHLSINWKSQMWFVHRLVWAAFNDLPYNFFKWQKTKTLVCHSNDDKQNNNLKNLFIWTQKDNLNDMKNKWRRMAGYKLNPIKVKLIKLQIKMWEKQKLIAKHWNVTPWLISAINCWRIYKYIS